jgi:hypothetical protein
MWLVIDDIRSGVNSVESFWLEGGISNQMRMLVTISGYGVVCCDR